jgi:hypothetical protein
MTTELSNRPAVPTSESKAEVLLHLAANPRDWEAIELLLDTQLWVVQEEVSRCIGRPPWFDSAVCIVLAEIVRRAGGYKPQKQCVAGWIRTEASRVGGTLEWTIPKFHVKDGVVGFARHESFEALLGSLLERHRSQQWDDLGQRQRLRPSARSSVWE